VISGWGSGASFDTKVVTTGTHRGRPFAETWAAVKPRLWDMGITRVANVTGLDDIGIPVIMVTRPNARTLAVSQGKGLTLEAARLSGVGEAAELFHAEEADLRVIRATPPEMARRAPVVDTDRLPLEPAGNSVSEEHALDWVEGDDLLSGGQRWVPHDCVAVGRTLPQWRTFASTSSGLAAGNSRSEALSHAICEAVERHSMTIWNSLPGVLKNATGVDLASVEDEACRTLLDRCAQAGVAVGVWNMTGQVEIPAFACRIAQRRFDGGRMVPSASGFGCHPSREVALARAITEAVQSRLTHIAGVRDDMTEAQYRHGSSPATIRQVLDFIEAAGRQEFGAVPSRQAAALSADVAWELDRLREASITEAVMVDLTREDIGIPVVRVVIPGLRLPGFRSVADERAGAP
jgi:YcaO-like protein with predicted kinase domain